MGLTDQRHRAKNSTDYRQNEEKITDQRQKNLSDDRHGLTSQGCLYSVKNRILNLFLGQEMFRSFAGLCFTRRNHIKSIVKFHVFKLLKLRDPSFRGAEGAHFQKSARLVQLGSLSTRSFEIRTEAGRNLSLARNALAPRFLYYSSLMKKRYLVM